MTFHIKKFSDLEHAVNEYKTRDFPEAPLILIFTDRSEVFHRVSMDNDILLFEEADERGAKKR
jgi:hypothetical protein